MSFETLGVAATRAAVRASAIRIAKEYPQGGSRAGRIQRFCLNRGMASPETLRVGTDSYSIYRLDALQASWDVARLPYTLRILLENVLRNGTDEEVEAVAGWVATDE